MTTKQIWINLYGPDGHEIYRASDGSMVSREEASNDKWVLRDHHDGLIDTDQFRNDLFERNGYDLTSTNPGPWLVIVQGCHERGSWEISVVHERNTKGQKSYGWLGEDKLLVSHYWGDNKSPVCDYVWDQLIAVAYNLRQRLNKGEDVGLKK